MRELLKLGDMVVQKNPKEYKETFKSGRRWMPLGTLLRGKIYKISEIRRCSNTCTEMIKNNCSDQFVAGLDDAETNERILFVGGGCHLRFKKVKRFSWRKI